MEIALLFWLFSGSIGFSSHSVTHNNELAGLVLSEQFELYGSDWFLLPSELEIPIQTEYGTCHQNQMINNYRAQAEPQIQSIEREGVSSMPILPRTHIDFNQIGMVPPISETSLNNPYVVPSLFNSFGSDVDKLAVFRRIFSIDAGPFKKYFIEHYDLPANRIEPQENAESQKLFEFLKPLAKKFLGISFKDYSNELLFWKHLFLFVLFERSYDLNSILDHIRFPFVGKNYKGKSITYSEFEESFYKGIFCLFHKNVGGVYIPRYFYSFENVSFLIVLLAVIRNIENSQPPISEDIPTQSRKCKNFDPNPPPFPIPIPIVESEIDSLPVEIVREIIHSSLKIDFDNLREEIKGFVPIRKFGVKFNLNNVEFLTFYWFHLGDLKHQGMKLRTGQDRKFLIVLLESAFTQYNYSFSKFFDRLGFTYSKRRKFYNGEIADIVSFGVFTTLNASAIVTNLHPDDPLNCLNVKEEGWRGKRIFASQSGYLFMLVLFMEMIKKDMGLCKKTQSSSNEMQTSFKTPKQTNTQVQVANPNESKWIDSLLNNCDQRALDNSASDEFNDDSGNNWTILDIL